jgi:hypothetical protein
MFDKPGPDRIFECDPALCQAIFALGRGMSYKAVSEPLGVCSSTLWRLVNAAVQTDDERCRKLNAALHEFEVKEAARKRKERKARKKSG